MIMLNKHSIQKLIVWKDFSSAKMNGRLTITNLLISSQGTNNIFFFSFARRLTPIQSCSHLAFILGLFSFLKLFHKNNANKHGIRTSTAVQKMPIPSVCSLTKSVMARKQFEKKLIVSDLIILLKIHSSYCLFKIFVILSLIVSANI